MEALQLDARINLKVKGFLAELTLVQQFQNTTNDWVEGRYLFPLNEASSIRALSMQTGDRRIVGTILPRAEARKTYEAAQKAGQVASVVEQQRPNLFTMKVANIAPGDTIEVTLDVVIPVDAANGRLSLRLPTTLTPRYTRADTTDAKSLRSPFADSSVIRGPRLTLHAEVVSLDNVRQIESRTHHLHYSDTGIALSNILMDRDVILEWPWAGGDSASSTVFVSEHAEERYVQILLNPPSEVPPSNTVSRELILVIDKSGSMAGEPIEAAREALHFAIDRLAGTDSFNIVSFDDRFQTLFAQSMTVNDQTRRAAHRFADALEADGGTEMEEALLFALTPSSTQTQEPDRLRQVVFLTDGSVGYEDALLSSIKRTLGSSRLFTIGIGSAPNTWFLEKAAETGRGVALNIANAQDVAPALTRLLSKLESPVLTDLSIHYAQGHGEAYPRPLPDLYADQPGMIVARVSRDVRQMILTGKAGSERWSETITLPAADNETHSAPAIAMDWTQRKVSSLLDEQRYAADHDLHKDIITQLGMEVGLVTPYTQFIAVEEPPTRPIDTPLSTKELTHLIPAGNEMMMVSLPRGAAGVDTLRQASVMMGLGGLLMLWLSRRLKSSRSTAQPH